jgi:two-component system sensor kinase FixL
MRSTSSPNIRIARQIIRRLRGLVRKGDAERRAENVRVTIEEAGALAQPGAGERLRLEIHVADDAAEAIIDKIQIQQVLLNLMRNAVEAMTDQRPATGSSPPTGWARW